MTVIKSKRIWRENFEKKILKHKDTTWMTAESSELTMSLTSFQEEMRKKWNWGKDSPLTGGRRRARTAEALWKQQRDQGENWTARTARHPGRRECGTRFFSSFGIIPPWFPEEQLFPLGVQVPAFRIALLFPHPTVLMPGSYLIHFVYFIQSLFLSHHL